MNYEVLLNGIGSETYFISEFIRTIKEEFSLDINNIIFETIGRVGARQLRRVNIYFQGDKEFNMLKKAYANELEPYSHALKPNSIFHNKFEELNSKLQEFRCYKFGVEFFAFNFEDITKKQILSAVCSKLNHKYAFSGDVPGYNVCRYHENNIYLFFRSEKDFQKNLRSGNIPAIKEEITELISAYDAYDYFDTKSMFVLAGVERKVPRCYFDYLKEKQYLKAWNVF